MVHAVTTSTNKIANPTLQFLTRRKKCARSIMTPKQELPCASTMSTKFRCRYVKSIIILDCVFIMCF